jgi:hypothetical protein
LPLENCLALVVSAAVGEAARNSSKLLNNHSYYRVFEEQKTGLSEFPGSAHLIFISQSVRILEIGAFMIELLLHNYPIEILDEFFAV